jgi:cadmium resistance protein CadD (predicted permease)
LEDLASNIALAITTFAVTNIDDLLILSVYFAVPDIRIKHVVAGQYLGVIALIIISLSGIVLGEILDPRYISLLGILPIILGLKGLYNLYRGEQNKQDEEEEIKAGTSLSFINVAIVTFANGGDNIGVYVPLFASIQAQMIALYVSIFIVLIGLWCVLGYYFVKHPYIKDIFEKYGRVILPCFLILLGLWIML